MCTCVYVYIRVCMCMHVCTLVCRHVWTPRSDINACPNDSSASDFYLYVKLTLTSISREGNNYVPVDPDCHEDGVVCHFYKAKPE